MYFDEEYDYNYDVTDAYLEGYSDTLLEMEDNSDYEDASKAAVIQRVYEWNKKVYNAKYWSSNPLTNWFWNKKYVDSLEYIELED